MNRFIKLFNGIYHDSIAIVNFFMDRLQLWQASSYCFESLSLFVKQLEFIGYIDEPIYEDQTQAPRVVREQRSFTYGLR